MKKKAVCLSESKISKGSNAFVGFGLWLTKNIMRNGKTKQPKNFLLVRVVRFLASCLVLDVL